MKKDIKYENASIDVTQYVTNELNKSLYLHNEKIKNLEIVEESLITYSKSKLEDWEKYDEEYENYNLEELLEILNNSIFSLGDQKQFFMQYIHCLMYLIGAAINRQDTEIEWGKETLDENAVIIRRDDKIKAIITNEKLLPYQVPTAIINKYRILLKKEKEKEKVLEK